MMQVAAAMTSIPELLQHKATERAEEMGIIESSRAVRKVFVASHGGTVNFVV